MIPKWAKFAYAYKGIQNKLTKILVNQIKSQRLKSFQYNVTQCVLIHLLFLYYPLSKLLHIYFSLVYCLIRFWQTIRWFSLLDDSIFLNSNSSKLSFMFQLSWSQPSVQEDTFSIAAVNILYFIYCYLQSLRIERISKSQIWRNVGRTISVATDHFSKKNEQIYYSMFHPKT
jgi:hypothetical protein